MGPIAIVLISGVSAFQGVKIYSSNGDTFRSFRAKCPLNRGVRISEVRISGVPLYIIAAFFTVKHLSGPSAICRSDPPPAVSIPSPAHRFFLVLPELDPVRLLIHIVASEDSLLQSLVVSRTLGLEGGIRGHGFACQLACQLRRPNVLDPFAQLSAQRQPSNAQSRLYRQASAALALATSPFRKRSSPPFPLSPSSPLDGGASPPSSAPVGTRSASAGAPVAPWLPVVAPPAVLQPPFAVR